MTQPDITISTHDDWNNFPGGRPELIVDPMIYRSADVYFRGRQGAKSLLPGRAPEQVWKALSANVGSLVAFFDAIILSERLPLIDYGYTFDSQIGFEQHELYQRCNKAGPENVLVSVHVMMDAYHQAKAAALAAMSERPVISDQLVASICGEMSTFDYNWQPDLSSLGDLPEDADGLGLLRFLYGGLLFSAYAQISGAGHLLQPKRSRLYLAASLNSNSAAYEYERQLFDELNRIAHQSEGLEGELIKIDALPPFLPYLLAKDPATPDELLKLALAMRRQPAVLEFRDWRRELLEDWRDKGKIDRSNERVIQEISRAIRRELNAPEEINVDFGVSASLTGIGIDLGHAIPIGRLWGWVLRQLPGRRYTKLLMRMHLAAHEYRRIDRHLFTIWERN